MNVKKETRFFNCNSNSVLLFIALFLFSGTAIFAQGDLLIFPKRVVFEGRKKVERITLVNSGKDSATYNISFKQYRMTETGKFEEITEPDPGQRFATPFLRVFPRRVNLAPGESQTVKVQLFNTNKINDGEYRSHLYFRAEKNNKPLGQEGKVKSTNTISVKLEAVFGISIATIIRKGPSNTVASISNLEFTSDKESNYFLNFNINRTGNMSTYGDITINYISGNNKKYVVGNVMGVAVYTPGNLRKVKMQLQKPEGVNFSGGKLTVVYAKHDGKKVFAETGLEL